MQSQRVRCIATELCCLRTPPGPATPGRTVAVLVPGIGMTGTDFVRVVHSFHHAFDVAVVDLPGLGNSSPLAEPTLDAMAAELWALIEALFAGRRVVVVGESLGGLVALALAGSTRPGLIGVAAVDPPLATAKQWPALLVLRHYLAAWPDDRPLAKFAYEFFGLRADRDEVVDRRYYQLLTLLRHRCLILTGEVPLGRPRKPERIPCCIDDDDRRVIQELRIPDLELVTLPRAGHLVLQEQPDDCRTLIEQRLASGPL